MKSYEDVLNYLENYYKSKYEVDNCSYRELVEFIAELRYDAVYETLSSEHRWWNIYFYIADVGGKYIGFEWAASTGDMTPYELGWEFDKTTLGEYEEKERTEIVKYYEPVKE